jgi:N-carbamoyl-L-amino-acid hydrolase
LPPKSLGERSHPRTAQHNAVHTILFQSPFDFTVDFFLCPCRIGLQGEHRQFRGTHAGATTGKAISQEIILNDWDGSRQGGHDRKLGPEHAGEMECRLGNTNDRRMRHRPRRIETGVIETGNHMRISTGLLRLQDPDEHTGHRKGTVHKAFDRRRTEIRLCHRYHDIGRCPHAGGGSNALRHARSRVRVDDMKPYHGELPDLTAATRALCHMKDQNGQLLNRGANLAISPDRLWDDLMETSAFGATAKGGICRLTLSDDDRKVRDWLTTRAQAIGCAVAVDDMGNMFARREGIRSDIPPIAMGSHLDTQPTGGKFDGVLGVLAALEAMRTLQESGYQTFAPVEVINFTNEEGSRFAPAMLASGVFAGVFEREWAASQKDRDGISFGQALDAIGYRGPQRCGDHPLSAYFELHIEQGPILEKENDDIGVVTGIQGIRWYEATLHGQEAHTGATPMTMRKNALLGAARMIEVVNAIALRHPPHAVATVGLVEVMPNSRNVVPAEVFFTIDVRHPEVAVLDAIENSIDSEFKIAISDYDLSGKLTRIWENPPVAFDPGCIASVRKAAATCGASAREMISGAGHDAAFIMRIAPAGMIFVPCKDGISHNETEFSAKEQCSKGAQVLLQSVIEYDRRLAGEL